MQWFRAGACSGFLLALLREPCVAATALHEGFLSCVAGRAWCCSPCKRGTGKLCAALRCSEGFAADCWQSVHVPERSISPRAPQKCSSHECFSVRVMKSARTYSSPHRSAVPGRPALLRGAGSLRCGSTDTPRPGGRGLTQNRSYTPYASAQKRTPSSNEENTGNRWRPPRKTFPKVSSRFFKIYVSFDHLS